MKPRRLAGYELEAAHETFTFSTQLGVGLSGIAALRITDIDGQGPVIRVQAAHADGLDQQCPAPGKNRLAVFGFGGVLNAEAFRRIIELGPAFDYCIAFVTRER